MQPKSFQRQSSRRPAEILMVGNLYFHLYAPHSERRRRRIARHTERLVVDMWKRGSSSLPLLSFSVTVGSPGADSRPDGSRQAFCRRSVSAPRNDRRTIQRWGRRPGSRTQLGRTVGLLTASPSRSVFVQQGAWRGAMVTQAGAAWSLPKVRLRGFPSPDSPASSHRPNTRTLWIIGEPELSVGVKQAS